MGCILRPGKQIGYWFALSVLMGVGALLRFSHADWDGGNQLHPDERAILFIAQTIEAPISLAQGVAPAQSPLNPFRELDTPSHSYPYGHLPLYATVLAQRLLSLPCKTPTGLCGVFTPTSFWGHLLNTSAEPRFAHLTYVGRALSALYDTLVILGAAMLARQLYSPRAGLLAAAFTTFAVLHIQNAHFGTVDTALSLFTTLTLWNLARYISSHHRRDSLIAGLCAGLALGSKVTAIFLLIPILTTHLTLEQGNIPSPSRILRVRLRSPAAFWLTLLSLVLTFTLTNPFVILEPIPFFTGIVTQAKMTAGGLDWTFTRQYANTLPLWYPIQQQARWTLGLPLTLAIYAGLIWGAFQALRFRIRTELVLLSWITPMLFAVWVPYTKFPRYMLPLTPTLFALAAGMLTSLKIKLGASPTWQPRSTSFKGALTLLVLIPTLLYALAFVAMYKEPHPWIASSQWLYSTLPPGTTVAGERWDDPLPLDINIDNVVYVRARVYNTRLLDPFAEPDDTNKLKELLSQLSPANYLILSSNRLYGVIPRLDDRYPLTAAYYQALFAGKLGFRLEKAFMRQPNLLGIKLYDDPFTRPGLADPLPERPMPSIVLGFADESFTVYDHPLTLVFRNQERLPVDELMAIVLRWAYSECPPCNSTAAQVKMPSSWETWRPLVER